MAAVSLGASTPVRQAVSASRGTPLKVTSLCGAGALSGAPICPHARDEAPGLRPRLPLLGPGPGLYNVTSVLWAVCCWDKDVGR